MESEPYKIILVGGGHAHLQLLEQAGKFRKAGGELMLVDPGDFCYSGMATGLLSGCYTPEDDRVDLGDFCQRKEVHYYRERMEELDSEKRILITDTGRRLPYDFLSLNIGSSLKADTFRDPEGLAWPLKPISRIPELKQHLETLFRRDSLCRVAVIGGGPTGCEVAANIQRLAQGMKADSRVTLLVREKQLLPEAPPGAGQILEKLFKERGIEICPQSPVVSLSRSDEGIELEVQGKPARPVEAVVSAVGLVAQPLQENLGSGSGGLAVDGNLNSLAHPSIFGAGDCIDFQPQPLPKVGVFGVRQAPILQHNLLACLKGESLRSFRPQKKYLTILNLGDGTALALRGNCFYRGRLAFLLKNFIDRRFMKRWKST